MIVGNRARSTSERDQWRLYDLTEKTVTFVDDVAQTIRTERLNALITRRRTATATAIPAYYPRLKLVPTGDKKPLHNASAERHVIESGRYKRELWLAQHPALPAGLLGMMYASEPVSSPLAPMTRAVDEALLATNTFPLADRSEVPLANGTMVIDRSVVSIAQQQVSEGALALPKNYKDLTPKPPAPAKSKKKKS
jgi:hypothetical protein